MIKFDVNPNPDIYDLLTKSVELDFTDMGGEKSEIKINSLASFKVADARAKFSMRADYAKKEAEGGSDILLEDGDIDAGLGVKVKGLVPTQWHKEHMALLAFACVDGYPEGRDLMADLIGNFDLCSFIVDEAIRLQIDFMSKKKS